MKHINQEKKEIKTFDVVVVGEINADLILSGNIEPEFGQVEKIIGDANLSMGSSAVIFASGAAKLGLRTAFIGVVGDDILGRFMLAEMKTRSINVESVKIDPELKTGLSVILTKENDRSILTYLGSIPELRLADIDFETISKSAHLHLTSYFMLDKLKPDVKKLFMKARDFGLTISVDTNYDPKETWNEGINDILPLADIFLPNETEIVAISKQKNLNRAIEIINNRTPVVVVKIGKDGAIGKKKGSKPIVIDALEMEVIDTVGAGDSFDAGFIYGYLKGLSFEDSVKVATICGSLSTRKAGGTSAQADWEEVKKYL